MKVELECPECGVYAPPPFAYPRPVYKCDNCGARTPHAELRKRTHMAIVRTGEGGGGFVAPTDANVGTAVSPLGGATLTISDVSVSSTQTIVVSIATLLGSGFPDSVTLGGEPLTMAVSGFLSPHRASIWYGRGFSPGAGKSLVATWSATVPASSAMTVTRLLNAPANPLDATSSGTGTNPTTPASGLTASLAVAGETCIACIASLEQYQQNSTWGGGFSLTQHAVERFTESCEEARMITTSTSPVEATSTIEIGIIGWVCCVATFKGQG